ncbi:DoxX family membrane protein [Chitinophaga eiseniae]|uniref:DoxX family membrane protein n=1 Tax=Chitinophaga eiseniae TaxID=634771 RepID=A0A847SM70_9BACT|nr:DoxX family membrane protein [Chitinophaga eiseniae]NLR77042.1 DoxX family membrane protein [Chitinophaga eiseniae]
MDQNPIMDTRTTINEQWPLSRKIAFRFFTVYFLLYIACNFGMPAYLWNVPVTWAGKWLIRPDFAITAWPNGSGDTTFNYLQLFCMVLFSLLVCIGWSLADRRRAGYNRLLYWLLVLLRYFLAVTMISYGLAKVFKTQFPFPLLTSLDERLGDMSPMKLAWSYMGYSAGYNLFTGAAECIGGLLLFFGRTRLLGALVSMGVMINVVAMNFCYDIPVKLFSAHLFFIALFIALPDIKRLVDFFLLNKPTEPYNGWQPTFRTRWKHITFRIAKYAIVITLLVLCSRGMVATDPHSPKPRYYGIYEVQSFTATPDITNTQLTQFREWQKIYLDEFNLLVARKKDNSKEYYNMKTDTAHHTLSFWGDRDTVYLQIGDQLAQGLLTLEGKVNGDSLHITLKQQDLNAMPLISRGFHWVNEYPFNW